MTIIVERLISINPKKINGNGISLDDTWKIKCIKFISKDRTNRYRYDAVFYNKKTNVESTNVVLINEISGKSRLTFGCGYRSNNLMLPGDLNIINLLKQAVKCQMFIGVVFNCNYTKKNKKILEEQFRCKFSLEYLERWQ